MKTTIYPWQQSQWELLQNSIVNHSVPHALLLSGQVGLGKKDFATQLSKTLLCETHAICQGCKNCHLFEVGNHPDFYLLEATGDKIQAIKVDQVREVTQKTAKTPAIAKRQVVLIQQADLLNIAASNALLKTLEEPLGDVVLILVSDDHTRLLPTIRSRCQTVLFQVPSQSIVESWTQKQKVVLLDLPLRLHLAAGAPLLAVDESMAVQINRRSLWIQLLLDLFDEKQTVVQVASQVMTDTFEQLLVLYRLVSDMIQDEFISTDYHRELRALKQYRSLNQWFDWLGRIQASLGLMKQQVALNQQLLWENLLI